MGLGRKLFFSYLAIAVVSLLTLSISASFLAPENFTRMMHGSDMGQMRGNQMGSMMASVDNDLDATFRQSVNNALIVSALVSIVTAIAVSWWISRRIVEPIRALAQASQHIADGHYGQRLDHHSNDELNDLVISFNHMAASLTDTENLRRQLIADVSHELKTPLAGINGLMEGLQDGVIEPTPETFQLVRDESKRLQRLVNDLQELSRVEADIVSTNREVCCPADVVSAVVLRLRPQYEAKGVKLDTHLMPNLPDIECDLDAVSQILTNLLGNALQFTPSDGHVTVTTTLQEPDILFSVRDTGIGIEVEDLKKIFHRFYRVDKSRSRSSGGSGIGLTIAQHLVHAQGGQLWAESNGLNKGSTFYFTLPVKHPLPIVTKSS